MSYRNFFISNLRPVLRRSSSRLNPTFTSALQTQNPNPETFENPFPSSQTPPLFSQLRESTINLRAFSSQKQIFSSLDEDDKTSCQNPFRCRRCAVPLQSSHSELPGYFIKQFIPPISCHSCQPPISLQKLPYQPLHPYGRRLNFEDLASSPISLLKLPHQPLHSDCGPNFDDLASSLKALRPIPPTRPYTFEDLASSLKSLHEPLHQNHSKKLNKLASQFKRLRPQNSCLSRRAFCSQPEPIASQNLREGNYDENAFQKILFCHGCGVTMQEKNSKLPGYFIKPSTKSPDYKPLIRRVPVAVESEISNSLKKGFLPELSQPETPNTDSDPKPLVCARCHSLRHYGKVKDSTVENLLPDFDFDHTIGKKLVSVTSSRSIVLMVVDAADFDGSFPRKVAKLVSDTIEENSAAWKQGRSGNLPRVVLVVTKIDLLPPSLSPTRLEHWIRQRAREGGANKLTSVHLVSAVRNWGLKNLVDDVCKLVGERGNVWAIGAQNAGKSTLINAIGKHAAGKVTQLTEAPVPGTTLGIIRVEGVLPRQAKLFDTPGLLNPHQITTRLTAEEQKLVHVRKELKPRTYRLKAGHTVHIAGLMRLDVEESSAESIYVTVWASSYLPLHMGKTENASTMIEHFGYQLQPPIGENRVKELGEWVKKEFRVNGNSWEVSSVDIAASGLGWFAVGLKGDAALSVWTYEGVDVTLRNSLLPQRAQFFEVAGFTVSKVVSSAERALHKPPEMKKAKKPRTKKEAAPDVQPDAST